MRYEADDPPPSDEKGKKVSRYTFTPSRYIFIAKSNTLNRTWKPIGL
jgi:hypothetical protein